MDDTIENKIKLRPRPDSAPIPIITESHIKKVCGLLSVIHCRELNVEQIYEQYCKAVENDPALEAMYLPMTKDEIRKILTIIQHYQIVKIRTEQTDVNTFYHFSE